MNHQLLKNEAEVLLNARIIRASSGATGSKFFNDINNDAYCQLFFISEVIYDTLTNVSVFEHATTLQGGTCEERIYRMLAASREDKKGVEPTFQLVADLLCHLYSILTSKCPTLISKFNESDLSQSTSPYVQCAYSFVVYGKYMVDRNLTLTSQIKIALT